MVFTLLSHQWTAFWRSRSAGKNVAVQIVLGLLILYFLSAALLLGIALRHILAGFFPGQDIIRIFCGLILYYFAFDLIFRFLLQELPVLSAQPYLIQNIKRRQLVAFLNIRSLCHFLNVLPVFIFIPFSCTVIAAAYGPAAAAGFVTSILWLVVFNHFLILYIKRKSIVNGWWLAGFLGVVIVFAVLDYFMIFSFRNLSVGLFTAILHRPLLGLGLVVLGLASLANNSRFLRRSLYVEEISRNGRQRQAVEYSWLRQWGIAGELIALDIKLILRNKRPRSVAMISMLIMLYGFFFYKPQFLSSFHSPMILLTALFITGIFLTNYGQFLFAWHSSYFDGLLSSDIHLPTFIRSRFLLFTAVSSASFIVASLYGLISWKIIPVQLAALLYNIGVNSVITVYFATRSYKSIDLRKGASFNYQGMGATQWLSTAFVMVFPLLLFKGVDWLAGPLTGYMVVGTLGLVNLLLQPWWVKILTAEFLKRKYLILEGFREK